MVMEDKAEAVGCGRKTMTPEENDDSISDVPESTSKSSTSSGGGGREWAWRQQQEWRL
jgi:hypothetical protein